MAKRVVNPFFTNVRDVSTLREVGNPVTLGCYAVWFWAFVNDLLTRVCYDVGVHQLTLVCYSVWLLKSRAVDVRLPQHKSICGGARYCAGCQTSTVMV